MSIEQNEEYCRRRRNGMEWQQTSKTCLGASVITGFTVDDLDTKEPSEAENKFESLFITVRKTLEFFSSCCMDEEEERLRVCQEISDRLYKDRTILFGQDN